MATKPVKVAYLADTADLRQSIRRAEEAMESSGRTAKTAGEKIDSAFDSTASHADDVASKGAQAAGALTGLGDLVGGKFGAAMQAGGVGMQAFADAGDLVNVVTESAIVKKIKDTAVTTVQTAKNLAAAAAQKVVAAATKAWAVAQRLLNLVLAANPIGLVIAALAALAVGLVLAYKKSETFRTIVNGAFEGVKKAASLLWAGIKLYFGLYVTAFKTVISFAGTLKDKITGGFRATVEYIKTVPEKISALGSKFKEAGSGLMNKIIDGIKNAAGFIGNVASSIWSAVKGLINGAIDKINAALVIKIPIPGAPDITVDPPNIPHLASGGIVTRPTLALVGEAGPEAVIPLGRAGQRIDLTATLTLSAEQVDALTQGRRVQATLDASTNAGVRRRA